MTLLRNLFAAIAAVATLALPAPALAQSGCSSITTGAVLTAAQWQACFQAKQDALGYTAVNRAGDTMTGRLITSASSAVRAGFNVPAGAAPTSPVDGDLWSTTSGLFVRINGATVGPLGTIGAYTTTGSGTVLVLNTSPTIATPSITGGTAPGLGQVAPWFGGYVSGRFYISPSGSSGNGPLTANQVYFTPIVIGEARTFDRIGFDLNATAAGSVRLAIYNNSNGLPSTLVIDGGTVSVAATPQMKTVTISQALAPGAYWLAMVSDVAPNIYGTSSISTVAYIGSTLGFANTTQDTLLRASMTFGAFPATAFTGAMGSPAYTVGSVPTIGLRAQ